MATTGVVEVARAERAARAAERDRAGRGGGSGSALPGGGSGAEVEVVDTWVTSEVVQNVLRRLSRHIDGDDDLLGYEIDEPAERVVVIHTGGADVHRHRATVQAILDGAEVDLATDLVALAQARVDDLSPAERWRYAVDLADEAAVVAADVDIEVEFRPVCRPGADDLAEVQREVESFGWADASIPTGFFIAVERELIEGRVVVTVAEADEVAEAARALLTEAFGDDVALRIDPEHPAVGLDTQVTDASSVSGGTWQPGRYVDRSPHMGGVQVLDWGVNGACTTGFAIDVDGGRSMLTAGHCETAYPVGTWLYSGAFADRARHRSYGEFYRSWFSAGSVVDVGLIGSARHTYRRKIYTDPDPSGVKERLVTAVWEPWVGARGVCFSGSFTGNRCTGTIVSVSSGCYRDPSTSRCGRAYTAESTDGRPLSQRGDSGGPVYVRSGRSKARALGIITHGAGARTTFLGSTAIYKATGGWIAHRCCDASSVVRR